MPKTSSRVLKQSDDQTSLFLGHPVRTSRSPADASEWMARVATWRSSPLMLFAASAPNGFVSRTSPASFPLTQEAQKRRVRLSAELPKTEEGVLASTPTVMKTVISPPSSPPFANAGILAATEFLTLSRHRISNPCCP